MTGFVQSGDENSGKGSEIMQEFNPTSLPTINTLGNDFAVIDQWFSSVPGPTQVFFFYSPQRNFLFHLWVKHFLFM